VTTHMCYLIIKMPFQIFVTSFYSTHLTFFWVETFVLYLFVCYCIIHGKCYKHDFVVLQNVICFLEIVA